VLLLTVLALTSITYGISRTFSCKRSVRSNLLRLNTTLVFLDLYFYNVRRSSAFSSTDCEAVVSLQDRNEADRPTDRSPLNREKDRQPTAGSLIIASVPSKGVTRPIFNYETTTLLTVLAFAQIEQQSSTISQRVSKYIFRNTEGSIFSLFIPAVIL
jgi:hypothetical protein